jgi:hypothetical protein
MRKLIISVLVGSVAGLPVAVSAQNDVVLGPYKSRGECVSALKQYRNDFRKAPSSRPFADQTGSLSGSDFNDWAKDSFECRKTSWGWYIAPVEG